MMPLTFRRLAQAELEDAVDWHEQRRAGLGVAPRLAVRQVFATITTAPESYPEVWDDVREAAVPNFPYAVYYQIRSADVEVIAVFHTSRDPAVWQARASN